MNLTKEKHATFTPGPWVAMGKAVYTESDNPTREILWGGHNTRSASDEEKKANARLIAAAPDLLEQCKFLERMLVTTDHHSSNKLAKVREVLAKVDGGEG
tara:strand:- start:7 stop:306 length:300 start_codon:yes stop_codon:yes gene_type:complete